LHRQNPPVSLGPVVHAMNHSRRFRWAEIHKSTTLFKAKPAIMQTQLRSTAQPVTRANANICCASARKASICGSPGLLQQDRADPVGHRGQPGVQEQQAERRASTSSTVRAYSWRAANRTMASVSPPPSSRLRTRATAATAAARCRSCAAPGGADGWPDGHLPGPSPRPTASRWSLPPPASQQAVPFCQSISPEHILGHGAVGGPLAAGHRDQAAAADQHGVLAAQALGVVAVVVLRLDQRPQADPDAATSARVGRASDSAPIRPG
jgi:hypothetical protein